MPVPRVVMSRQPHGVVKTYNFKAFSFDPTLAEEFTLPFYGLPPVDGRKANAARGQRPVWLAGIGVVGLGLAFGIRRVGENRQSRSTSA